MLRSNHPFVWPCLPILGLFPESWFRSEPLFFSSVAPPQEAWTSEDARCGEGLSLATEGPCTHKNPTHRTQGVCRQDPRTPSRPLIIPRGSSLPRVPPVRSLSPVGAPPAGYMLLPPLLPSTGRTWWQTGPASCVPLERADLGDSQDTDVIVPQLPFHPALFDLSVPATE